MDGKAAPENSLHDPTYLRQLLAKLQSINQQQATQIHFLKEINFRLRERDKIVTDFIYKGGLRQHEESQDQALTEISRINREMEPIFQSLEQGSGLDPEVIKKLRRRSREVEAQLLEMRDRLKKQRQELLDQLSEKEISLRLQHTDMESICAQNRQLKDENRLLRQQNYRLEEGEKEKERLQKHISKIENEMDILKKKYRLLISSKETFESTKNIAQENSMLKKTVFQLEEKWQLARMQKMQLQLEYEKLMEEYERLFSQI